MNNYFAVKTDGDVKRKGEYSKAGLVEKKNPDVEICADAVAEFLANGTPIAHTIAACRDIRKFVTIQKVNGAASKCGAKGRARVPGSWIWSARCSQRMDQGGAEVAQG